MMTNLCITTLLSHCLHPATTVISSTQPLKPTSRYGIRRAASLDEYSQQSTNMSVTTVISSSRTRRYSSHGPTTRSTNHDPHSCPGPRLAALDTQNKYQS